MAPLEEQKKKSEEICSECSKELDKIKTLIEELHSSYSVICSIEKPQEDTDECNSPPEH